MSKETRRHLKPVVTRPGIMYGSYKVHKKCFDGCLSFRPILSALQTPTYKPTTFLVAILELLTTNKYRLKGSFNFATEIMEQDTSNFMGSLDIDSLSTNISLKENLDTYTNEHFRKKEIVHGLQKKVNLRVVFYI